MFARAVVLAVLASVVAAQGPRGPVWKPEPGTAWDLRLRDPSRIVLKFREGAAVRLRGGHFVGRADLADLDALVAAAATRAARLFARPEAELDAERAGLLARAATLSVDPPADLNNYYALTTADVETGARLIDALNAHPAVETAFAEHRGVQCDPGDIPPLTPDLSANQSWRNPAPTGIDHRAGRVLPGGRGDALQVIDIESSWRLNHEDVPNLVPANVIGAHDEALNPNHGVAVCGEINAEWDRHGMTGVVDLAALKVHSHMRVNWASSVDVAAANSPPGGFIVLEVQLSLSGRLTPMEVRQDVFDAVRNAVLSGKHVIAAAGNGSNDLDDPFFQNLFNRSVRDSGSVLVGATEGASLVRASFSNYGSAIDANGWGRNVATTGYGDLGTYGNDVRQQYTATFSGTSSATPIVTGAAMALAGALREQDGRALTPAELRDALRQHGTDVPGGSIGKRPDLVLLLGAFGLPRGLDLPVEGGVGGNATFRVSGPAGAPFALAFAADRGFADLGPLGRFLLDPTTLVVGAFGTVGGAGRSDLTFPVPNDPVFDRVSIFAQALVQQTAGFALTNSVRNYSL